MLLVGQKLHIRCKELKTRLAMSLDEGMVYFSAQFPLSSDILFSYIDVTCLSKIPYSMQGMKH